MIVRALAMLPLAMYESRRQGPSKLEPGWHGECAQASSYKPRNERLLQEKPPIQSAA